MPIILFSHERKKKGPDMGEATIGLKTSTLALVLLAKEMSSKPGYPK